MFTLRNAFVTSLMVLALGTAGLVGCSKKETLNDDEVAISEGKEKRYKQDSAKAAEYEQRMADIEAREAEIAEKEEAINRLIEYAGVAGGEDQEAITQALEASLTSKVNKIESQIKNLREMEEIAQSELEEAQGQIEQTKSELEEARGSVEKANSNLEAAKAEAQRVLDNATGEAKAEAEKQAAAIVSAAEKIKAEAEATEKLHLEMLGEANKKKAEALEMEKQNQAVRAKLNQDIAELEEAKTQWRELYETAGLDFVFDTLTDDEMNNDAIAFQVSVVGLANAHDIFGIRHEINKINKSQVYRASSKYFPSLEDVRDNLAKEAEIAEREGKEIFAEGWDTDVRDAWKEIWARTKNGASNLVQQGVDAAMFDEKMTVNDRFVVKTTGKVLRTLRDQIVSKQREEGNSIYFVVRPIRNVKVDLILTVATRGDLNEPARVVKTLKKVKLSPLSTEDRGIDINQIDLGKPYQYVFGDEDPCKSVDDDCFEALSPLFEGVKVLTETRWSKDSMKTTGQTSKMTKIYRPVKSVLIDLLEGSTHQLGADIAFTYKGEVVFGKILSMNEDAELEKEWKFGRDPRLPIVESITIGYQLSMVQEIPKTGMIPLDALFEGSEDEVELNLKTLPYGFYSVALPFSKLPESEVNFLETAQSLAQGKNPRDELRKELFQQILLVQSMINELSNELRK